MLPDSKLKTLSWSLSGPTWAQESTCMLSVPLTSALTQPVLINNLTKDNLDRRASLYKQEPLVRPTKRTLENIYLKTSSQLICSKQLQQPISGKLSSVTNSLLEIRSLNENKKPKLDHYAKYDVQPVSQDETNKSECILVGKGLPTYHFDSLNVESKKEEVLFGDLDASLYEATKKLQKTREGLKIEFLETIAASLVNSANFKNDSDSTRQNLFFTAKEIAQFDPEFILKAALYARQELNIRTTANFLLAVASVMKPCRFYLRKYYNKTIRIPSDWLEVAILYQTFSSRDVLRGSVPSMLRKVMVEKFQDFDDYQLAKYNKKPKKKPKEGSEVIRDEDEVDEKHVFTLKRMIRLLHINKPSEAIMCLLGKKYPSDPESFRQCGFVGIWNPEKAGKRMKLPVPVTWETQISANGNKPEVWQNLLDEKKLPYMAMLRNIRNIIGANVSSKHHDLVIKLLSNKRAVINSRQLPLSFYNAYEILCDIEDLINKSSKGQLVFKKPKNADENDESMRRRIMARKIETKVKKMDASVIPMYKKSIDKAIQISVQHNLDPIPGRTLVICDVLSCWRCEANYFKLVKQNLLLGLMCLSACEHCDIKMTSFDGYVDVQHGDDSILDAVRVLAATFENCSSRSSYNFEEYYKNHQQKMWESYLDVQASSQQPINTVLFLTADSKPYVNESTKWFLSKYRSLCNPNLLFVHAVIGGPKIRRTVFCETRDVSLEGVSDQLLKFLATQGTSLLLGHVERIDSRFDLKPLPRGLLKEMSLQETKDEESDEDDEYKLPAIKPPLRWKTLRVFISSTFKDMHGERDLLVRYVFPEIRSRARKLLVNVHEIDLRWGITEEESVEQKALELCLSKASRCHFFLGILGERYGTVPSISALPNEPEFDWVREYPTGASVTELEIYSAALNDPESSRSKAFFYFRDNSFLKQLPRKWYKDFSRENYDSEDRMKALKNRIQNDGFEVFENYPCQWGKEINNVPILLGLELFGQRVLDNLWNAISKTCEEDAENEINNDDLPLDDNYIARLSLKEKYLTSFDTKGNVIGLYGKPGSGKSTFLSHLVSDISEKETCCYYFMGLGNNSLSLDDALLSLCHSVCSKLSLAFPVPTDKLNLETVFWDIMTEASKKCPSGRLILILDGIDKVTNQEDRKLFWLPQNIDSGIRIVLSVNEGDTSHKVLQERQRNGQTLTIFNIDPISIGQRKSIVENTLAMHRKTLSIDAFNNQLLLLVTKRDAVLPLYLKLACEQLRLFQNFDELTPKIKSLPQSLPQLLQEIMQNLEQWHGKSLVEATMTLLALSQDGLEEHELQDLLSLWFNFCYKDTEFHDLVHAARNPRILKVTAPATLASLYRSIRTVLDMSDSTSKLSLGESQISNQVKARYLGIGTSKKALFTHKLLGAYFISVSDPNNDGTWTDRSSRTLRAVPYYLHAANLILEFSEKICTMNFLNAAFHTGETPFLLDTMGEILRRESKVVLSKPIYDNRKRTNTINLNPMRSYYDFISSNSHIQHASEVLAIQQALCEPESSIVLQNAKEHVLKSDSHFFEWISKPAERQPCKLMISDFPVDILCCTANGNASILALGGSDGVIRLLSPQTGKVLRSLMGHGQGISCLVFLNSNSLCCGSFDNTLSLWDVDKGIRINILTGHTRRVTDCCSNSTGKNIVSVSWDTTIRIWDCQDGKQLSTLENKKPLTSVAFHPQKDIIASGDFEKTVKLWDLEKLKRIAVLKGHSSSVQCVAFSPTGLNIVSSSLMGEIFIWATLSGTLLVKSATQSSTICKVLYGRNGALLSCGWDGSIKVWSNLDQTPVLLKDTTRKDTLSLLHALSLDKIFLAYVNGLVVIYDLEKNKEMHVNMVGDEISAIGSYSDFWVVVGTVTGIVKIVYGNENCAINYHANGKVTSLACNDTNLVVGSIDGVIAAISSVNGVFLKKITQHDGPVLCLSFTETGLVVSGGSDQNLVMWNIANDELKSIIAQPDWITSIACGKEFIASGSLDSTVKIWHEHTLQLQNSLSGLNEPVSSVHIIENNIFAVGLKGNVALWNRNGQLMSSSAAIETRLKVVVHLEKDSEETTPMKGVMAFIGENNILQVKKSFNIFTNYELNGHKGPVTGVAVINDNLIVSTSSDRSVRWWNTATTVKKGHSCKIIEAQISQKGLYAFSADVTCISLWKISLQDKTTLELVSQVDFKSPCITAASFLNNEGTNLLIATNKSTEDGNRKCEINLYHFIDSELKRMKKVNVNSEVTCIEWSPQFNSVTLAKKTGFLSVTDVNLKKFNSFEVHDDWASTVKKIDSDKTYLCTYINSAILCYHNYADAVNNESKDHAFFHYGSTITSSYQCGLYIMAGCSDGELVRENLITDYKFPPDLENPEGFQSESRIKIHSNAITGICKWKSFTFTSSLDRTVKAWVKDFKQVGQFTYNSPITKLSIASFKEDRAFLLFGTDSGEVHILSWVKYKSNTKSYEFR